MHKQEMISLLLISLVVSQPCLAQGLMEGAGTYSQVTGLSAGLGAGLAASRGHGEVLNRSYSAMVRAQMSIQAQTKAIEQYMGMGCKFEAAKQWDNAEKAFKYVLQVVAKRDGPGSSNSLPVLEHLVTVTQAEDKVDDAIQYQKTVIAFSKAAKAPDYQKLVGQQVNLSNLFMQKDDYVSAAPPLNEAITTSDRCTELSNEQRCALLNAYAKLLRKTRKHLPTDKKILTDGANPKTTETQESPLPNLGEGALPPEKAALKPDETKQPADSLPTIAPPGELNSEQTPSTPKEIQPPAEQK